MKSILTPPNSGVKLQDVLQQQITPPNFVEEERLHWSSQLNLQNLTLSPVLVSSS